MNKYVGKILGANNELNGFSFNGVGSGTTLHHLQAYRGSDDGFEFFETVNLMYAILQETKMIHLTGLKDGEEKDNSGL